MAIETKRDKLIYLALVPIIGAILGALATAIFQIAASPSATLPSAVEVLHDHSLSAAEKIKLLDMIKEVGDRPWAVIRTLVGSLTFLVGVCAIPLSQRIANR